MDLEHQWVGPSLGLDLEILSDLEKLPRTNPAAYFAATSVLKNNVLELCECYKTFLSVIYDLFAQATVFVGLDWKSFLGTNALAYYKNS